MEIRARVAVALILLLLARGSARAQAKPNLGAQQFATLGEFKLQSGQVIRDFRLGYRILGKLNAKKTNAILWCTALGGRSEELFQYTGAGNVVDTDKYYVILVDAIGNGVTSSPSNSKSQPLLQFPQFAIRDMVEAEHRLAAEVLHLRRLRAVIGVSMGGMQVFEWAVAYPDFIELAIPLLGSPQSTSADKLLWTAEIDAVQSDPAWHGGHPAGTFGPGLQLAREIHAMNMTSPAYRVEHTSPTAFDFFLSQTRKDWTGDAGTASDMIRQRQAILALDIPGEFHLTLEQAASRVRAKMLVVISPQDHMVNPLPAKQFAAAIGAPVITLDSSCGHISLACISAGPVVAQFLSKPDAVRSQTLRESPAPR